MISRRAIQMAARVAFVLVVGLQGLGSMGASAATRLTSAGTVKTETGHVAPEVTGRLGQLPLYFVENKGQVDSAVAYYVSGKESTVYFSNDSVTIALKSSIATQDPERRPLYESDRGRYVIRLRFPGATVSRPEGLEPAQAVFSYFSGRPNEWVTGAPSFRRLVYHGLWPGIDLVFSSKDGALKYEFLVQPGADPRQIRFSYEGISGLHLRDDGAVDIEGPSGTLLQDTAPFAYQDRAGERNPVATAYILGSDGVSYGFAVGAYSPDLPLVIDPQFVYCGYVGGSSLDDANAIAVDKDGAVYLAGSTFSDQGTFPVVVGPDTTYEVGAYHIYVAKVRPDGTGLVYCGYISGAFSATGIAVDSQGAAYVTGLFGAYEALPVIVGPDLTPNGSGDAFVLKVRPDGTGLVYCGYIGGSGWDEANALALGPDGSAYVTGKTRSGESTFPVKVGPDTTYNGSGPFGDGDAFVARVRPDGTGLMYCGYIGGLRDDVGRGIAVDATGAAYVVGKTYSTETSFPVKVGPDLTYGYLGGNLDDSDGFIAKVEPDGSGLVYCGYIGGKSSDEVNAVAVDNAGQATAVGKTYSSEENGFPVVVGPDTTADYGSDAFVVRLRADGTGFVYAGFIAGIGNDTARAVALDGSGAAYVAGNTDSSEEYGFPVLGGPDVTFNGDGDAFVAEVRPNGSGLVYCTYIGGLEFDVAFGIAVDSEGNAYVAGSTTSLHDRFPVLIGPDLTYNGDGDAFVAKIGPGREYLNYISLLLRNYRP